MKYITAAIAFLFIVPMKVFAGDAVVTWTTPTQYEDGTVLPANEIASYKIYYGLTSNGPYTYQITVPGTLNTVTVTGLTKGVWYFVATTVATNGLESVYTGQVSKTVISTSRPNPPGNLR